MRMPVRMVMADHPAVLLGMAVIVGVADAVAVLAGRAIDDDTAAAKHGERER